MSPSILRATNILRQFLFDRVYKPSLMTEAAGRAKKAIWSLYHYFLKHQEKLPEEYICRKDEIERKVSDYISGMTDQYALQKAQEIRNMEAC